MKARLQSRVAESELPARNGADDPRVEEPVGPMAGIFDGSA
jgi:hypothetical protein